MRFYLSTILLTGFLFIAIWLPGSTTMTESQQLNAFFEEEWEYSLEDAPIWATRLGDFRYNDRLGDFSIEAVKRRRQHDTEALKRLQTIDRTKLAGPDQLNYDLYATRLKLQIEGYSFPSYLMPINQLEGLQQLLPQLYTFTPFRNTRDYEDYLARLSQIPVAIDQTIAALKEGMAESITQPRITLRDVDDQIRSQVVTAPQESLFYEPFRKFSEGIPDTDQESLRQKAASVIQEKVIPAFQKLYTFWNDAYYPKTRESIAITDLPKGGEWYAHLVKRETTTDLTAQQIHEIGLQEVKRIRAEMDSVIRESGFKGSFEEFVQFLRTDPQFFYTKPEDLLAGYRDICKQIDAELPKFFGKLPRLPYGVREIPAFSAPSQTTAYYNAGSLQAGRPGWYYANTYKLDTRPKWEMEPLSIHEAVPGHHLQIALAQEMENVPKFRNYDQYTAYVEGWGLYSESLGEEMGFYKDPYSKFGQLTYEMWRAIRLVLDTGIHTMGWSRQQAIDYFKANSAKTENDITVEVDRYIVWPGQALAYKIGELKIKELRRYAEEQLGDRFDIREFHDRVLESGALPLSILEKQIKDYVARKKN